MSTDEELLRKVADPTKVTVSFGKKVSKNFQSYECHIYEEWSFTDLGEQSVEDFIRIAARRIKHQVNEQLGIQIREAPDA